jgi:hypothetical protein
VPTLANGKKIFPLQRASKAPDFEKTGPGHKPFRGRKSLYSKDLAEKPPAALKTVSAL